MVVATSSASTPTATTTKASSCRTSSRAGRPFERLIDHPSWIDRLRTLARRSRTLRRRAVHRRVLCLGPPGRRLFVSTPAATAAPCAASTASQRLFRCGQVNILMALTDIGPGDGATMVIPGSHKSNLPHPRGQARRVETSRMDDVEGADRGPPRGRRCAAVLRRHLPRRQLADQPRGRAPRGHLPLRTVLGLDPPRLRLLRRAAGRVTPAQRDILQPIRPRGPRLG